jgi:hypothetical protein
VLDGFTSDPFRGTVLVRGRAPAGVSPTVIVLPTPFTGRPTATGAKIRVESTHGVRRVLVYPRGGVWQLRVG